MGPHFWRDSRTVIADFDNYTSVIAISPDSKLAFAAHGINRVVDEICPDLIKLTSERVHKQRNGLLVALHRNATFEFVIQDR